MIGEPGIRCVACGERFVRGSRDVGEYCSESCRPNELSDNQAMIQRRKTIMMIELAIAIVLIGVWFVIGLVPYYFMGGRNR